jgi:hypothetical protein
VFQTHTYLQVYSYGTLLYELVTGETLFASQIPESGWSGVEKRIIAGDRPEVPTGPSPLFAPVAFVIRSSEL